MDKLAESKSHLSSGDGLPVIQYWVEQTLTPQGLKLWQTVGSNNLADCSDLCHAPSTVGLKKVFGSGTSMVSLENLKHSDCVVLIGSNAPANHPRLMNEDIFFLLISRLLFLLPVTCHLSSVTCYNLINSISS